jgi:hypothetical protein
MIAEIASGNFDAADIFFLIAIIAFAIAAVVPWVVSITRPVAASLLALGGGFLALGFLVL